VRCQLTPKLSCKRSTRHAAHQSAGLNSVQPLNRMRPQLLALVGCSPTLARAGRSVRSAQLEMNMVAEGYNASKCMYLINKEIKAEMPIADMVYRILWENVKAGMGFKQIEPYLV